MRRSFRMSTLVLWSLLAIASSAPGQSPQTYVQGTGTGLAPSGAGGANVAISSGSVPCNGTLSTLSSSTNVVPSNGTNYVYIDQTSGCGSPPTFSKSTSQKSFQNNQIPIAIAIASGCPTTCNITSILDVRPWYVARTGPTNLATDFSGTNAGEQIANCIAALPSVGGTCDARGQTGAQTISTAIGLDRPVRLILGASTWTCTSDPCFDITSGNIIIEGQGASSKIISAAGGTIFSRTAAGWLTTPLIFRHMELQGGGGASRAMFFANETHNDSPLIIEDIAAHDFGATTGAFEFGKSVGFVNVRNSHFYNNYASFSFYEYDELRIDFSEFYNPKGGPQIRIVGRGHAWVNDNTFFYHTGGTGTAPEIYIEAIDAAGNTGNFIRINRNRFGPESEINGRYKIKIGAASNTYTAAGPIWITENDFGGSSDSLQKAIGVTIPTGQLFVDRNQFSLFGTLIDDTVDLSLAGSTLYGMGTFLGNYHRTAGGAAWKSFTNGGRCFNKIELPIGESKPLASAFFAVEHESPELRNRFAYSENFDSWTKIGVTVTAPYADPFGGTNARLLTRDGLASSEYVRAPLDTTAQTDQVFFSIWLKAGTLTTAQIRLIDNSQTKRVTTDINAELSTSWRKFKIPWHGLVAANGYSVFVFPGGEVLASGTIYAYAAQASDFPSSYYPTTGTALSSARFGARFQNGVIASRALVAGLNTVTPTGGPPNCNAITFDASLGNTQKITLNCHVTAATLSNATQGQTINFIVCQDGSGNRNFQQSDWDADNKVEGWTTVGTTANTCSAQTFVYDGSKAYAVATGKTNMPIM